MCVTIEVESYESSRNLLCQTGIRLLSSVKDDGQLFKMYSLVDEVAIAMPLREKVPEIGESTNEAGEVYRSYQSQSMYKKNRQTLYKYTGLVLNPPQLA